MHVRINDVDARVDVEINKIASEFERRPRHLSLVTRDKSSISRLVTKIKSSSKEKVHSDHNTHDCDVWSRIKWSVEMNPLGIFHVCANDVRHVPQVKSFGLFYHLVMAKLSVVTCFQDADGKTSRYSTAKILVKPRPTKIPFMDADGAAYVISINNMVNDYRIGSVLIQAAVELSFEWGFDGRVVLCSEYESGQFYSKLGFSSLNFDTQEKLVAGEHCSAGLMSLEASAIDVWKKKIATNSIFEFSQKNFSNQHRFFNEVFQEQEDVGCTATPDLRTSHYGSAS